MGAKLAPLLDSAAAPILVAIALAMAVVYGAGHRGNGAWAAILLRVLAVAGFVIPGWTVVRWYEGLARVRDIARRLPVHSEPVVERFVASSAALLAMGFALLLAGVHLARRLPRGQPGEGSIR